MYMKDPSQRKAETPNMGEQVQGVSRDWCGGGNQNYEERQIIQPHDRTTKTSSWEMISGIENGLSHPLQKYLRAYSVPGRDPVIEIESP